MTRDSDLRVMHLQDLTPHYATTLRRWRENFLARWEELQAMGFSESFRRTWEFYFSYCEAGFLQRHVNVCQLIFGRADETAYAYETISNSEKNSQGEVAILNAS